MARAKDAYDVVVIGGGPGGYTAAIRATHLGLTTALIEPDALGGLCLNRGCIPTKALLHTAETESGPAPKHAASSYLEAVKLRDTAVAHLLQGLTNLLKTDGVTLIAGTGRLLDAQTLAISTSDGEQTISCANLIIATGSLATRPPIPGADLPGVIDSDGALALVRPPRRAVIVGGGPVGVEWAEIWRAFGSEVTVVELLPSLVPNEEPEIGRELARLFKQKGITCLLGAQLREIRTAKKVLSATVLASGEERAIPTDIVLMATGRHPNVDNLNLEAAGVALGPHGIATDTFMCTNVPHIYAVGDVTGKTMLAHVASHQGIVAADAISGHGHAEPFHDHGMPSVVFTDPEIASIGLGEKAVAELGFPIRIGRFPFAASGRAQATGQTDGFVKIVARDGSNEILGIHIIGPRAGELISEGALALRL
ncbi:MAG TPA: dihydrolipoyl dehydrogenase, partial [Chloroflexota bacterium]